jgi:O-antigen/teichoic acid export membrane protein
LAQEVVKTDSDNLSKKHIRGSSILLLGRFIALGINFFVQVLTVRYLATVDYGTFEYVLTLASIGSSLTLFSMDKALSRFLPIFDEHGEDAKQRGTIILTFGAIVGLSLALLLLVFAFQAFIGQHLVTEPLAMSLLLILIFLAPVGAFDNWFQSLFAVYASAKAIFFRRHILGPLFKLGAVLIVILAQSDIYLLAWGYLVGGVLGLLSYGLMLQKFAKKHAVLRNWQDLSFPTKAIFGFSSPLLYSDLVFILRNNAILLVLEFFHTAHAVAEYRAVVHLARLNEVILHSFTFLYIPLAARLFARNDKEGINEIYWQTALWISIFSFPVFIVTFALAQPVTVFIFQERYAASAPILALLSLGYYFNAALGFNNHTLRIYGKMRYLFIADILATCAIVILCALLIPPFGALGAAFAAGGTLIIHNLLNHFGLYLYTDVRLFDMRYLKAYIMVAAVAIGLFLLQISANPPLYVGLPLAALFSLLLLRLNRKQLNVAEIFPELLKIKILRVFLEV